MPRMRKTILTIEVTTCMPVRRLRELESLAFGIEPMKRETIRQVMPDGWDHDCMGTTEQVQVHVVKPAKKASGRG